MISSKIEYSNGNFGEIYLLTPGEDIILNVDYNSVKTTIMNDENAK